MQTFAYNTERRLRLMPAGAPTTRRRCCGLVLGPALGAALPAEAETAGRTQALAPKASPTAGPATPAMPATSVPPFTLSAEVERAEVLKAALEKRPPPAARLTAKIANVPLRAVLTALSRETGINVYVMPTVPDAPISMKFYKLSLEEGIKRILEGNGYLLSYAGANKDAQAKQPAERRLTEIRVLRKGAREAGDFQQIPTAQQQRASQAARLKKLALEAKDAKERYDALDELPEVADEEETKTVMESAMRDPDPKVRARAIAGMADTNRPAYETVQDLVTTDENPEVRSTAIETLAAELGGGCDTHAGVGPQGLRSRGAPTRCGNDRICASSGSQQGSEVEGNRGKKATETAVRRSEASLQSPSQHALCDATPTTVCFISDPPA